MPQVAAAIAALDAQKAARTLREGGAVAVSVDGRDYPLASGDVQLKLQPLEGYQLERSGSHAVALDLELDEDLHREGLAREVVHAIQGARKSSGLSVEDRISLTVGGDPDLIEAVRANEPYVTGETLATSLDYDGADGAHAAEIEGRRLSISVRRS